MNQKEAYTEFWKLLSLVEDSIDLGYKNKSLETPQFKSKPSIPVRPKVEPLKPKPQLAKLRQDRGLKTNVNPNKICENCSLFRQDRSILSGSGALNPKLLILLGPPDFEAEKLGQILAPPELEYLEKWLEAIKLSFDQDVFVLNWPACRPPGNRVPFPNEIRRCGTRASQIIDQKNPDLILALGPIPGAYVIGQPQKKVSQLREGVYSFHSKPVLISYSPKQVLSYPQLKRPVWEDLKRAKEFLDGHS